MDWGNEMGPVILKPFRIQAQEYFEDVVQILVDLCKKWKSHDLNVKAQADQANYLNSVHC